MGALAETPRLVPVPPEPPPISGSIVTRVRYCECDPMGVAHHASYVAWLEMARTELLRASGVSYAQLEREGVFLVVVRLEVKYRRPIVYDDVVEIRTRVFGGSRVKIEHEYELLLREDGGGAGAGGGAGGGAGAGDGGHRGRGVRAPGEVLAVARTTLACVDAHGRVRPLPDWLVPAPA